MTRLGSVFDDDGGGSRGPDLRVEVEVPRNGLGDPAGVRVKVPLTVAVDGQPVRRVDPHEEGDSVCLHLPATLPDNATLRLRGQGGVGERPGDLLVHIHLVDPAPTSSRPPAFALVLLVVAAASGAAWFVFL